MSAHTSVYNEHGLSHDALAARVPSIFAASPFTSVSSRYGFVPTIDVVEGLKAVGLRPVSAGQTLTRVEGKRDFTRHVVRFRPDYAPTIANQALPEVVLLNSHDGSSGFKLWLGMFRMVCANGMIVCNSTLGAVSIPHRSNAVERARDESLALIERVSMLADTVERFQSVIVPDDLAFRFAEESAQIRWGSERPAGLNARDLLMARRFDDAGKNLWSVLNTVQENLTKGGVNLTRIGRRSTTRGLRSVQDDARMNAGVWSAAEGLYSQLVEDVETV
jgi:hypothetical protein